MKMFIDQCYCINLYERNDRMHEVNNVFNKYNLPVNFYRTNRDVSNGERGCFNSHVSVIKKAYNDKLNNVLIFEDDAVCDLDKNDFDNKMVEIYNFIKNYDYDIFFLGSVPEIVNNRVTHIKGNIYKVNAFCAHAYILSNSGINKYKDLVYENIPIDRIFQNSNKAYAIYPSIFYQNESKSDIAPNWVKFYGFKISLGKLIESYAMHINLPLKKLIIIFIVIIIFVIILLQASRTKK